MDKKEIRKHLIDITHEEIPDVNLLPEIQKQLAQKTSPSTRTLFTVARMAAVFALLLAVGAVLGYAVVQSTFIPTTIPQDLVTELNASQTIEDATAVVTWAYADEHRMALELNISYDATVTALGSHQVTLQTIDGTIIPPAFGGGGGGDGTGGAEGTPAIVTRAFSSSYDMSAIETSGDTIDLILTIQTGYQEQPAMPSGSGGGGGGGSTPPATTPMGGSGGGGGGNATPNNDIVPASDAPDREFVLEFSVPLYPARDGAIAQNTQTVDGNDVTIQNVRVTPSMTIFELCSPLFAEGWLPQAQLLTGEPMPDYLQGIPMRTTLDGEVVYPALAYNMQPVEENSDCRVAQIPAPFSAESGELTIIVDSWFRDREQDTIEDIEADVAYFAELGFELSYEIAEMPYSGMGDQSEIAIPISSSEMVILTVEDYPEALDLNGAIAYIASNALQDRIEGDWELTVTVD